MRGWVLSPAAFDDLDEILAFVESDSGSAASADRLLGDFRAAFELVASQPEAGLLRDDLTGTAVRWWLVHRYLVLYAPDTRPVRIVRVIHGARALGAILDA